MMKKRIRQWAALCAAVGIAGSAVMGCGSSAPKPDAGSGQTSREAADGAGTGSGGGAHIGIIFTEAGLGGNSFNDLALEGVKKAAADYGITYDEVEPKSVSDEEIIQDEMAASGDYDLIICVGAEQVDALTNVASTYPEQRFAVLDATSELPIPVRSRRERFWQAPWQPWQSRKRQMTSWETERPSDSSAVWIIPLSTVSQQDTRQGLSILNRK